MTPRKRYESKQGEEGIHVGGEPKAGCQSMSKARAVFAVDIC